MATLPPPPTLPPVPTSTQLPFPDASPTPEPVLLMTAADFGTGRNPLTGELMADAAVLQRRPIACKLSNAPAEFTRPQSGINDADLLFEHVTEGRLTRFTAIFYGKIPPDIGPIRSARLIDVELPAMYDAGLCYSGASEGVSQRLAQSDFRGRLLFSSEDGYYRTGADKPYEHTLYAHPEGLWAGLDRRGKNVPPVFQNNMQFSSVPPDGGEPATHITIDYVSEIVEWRYDPENGRYWRWSDGEIHRDANTGEQVNYRNVAVVFAITVEDPSICEQIANGVCVALSLEIQLWGSGRAVVFRDGFAYEAAWRREDRHDMLTFTDANGDPLPLQIGNTVVQVVTVHRSNQLSYEP
ncbi:MAG: DUF3048 domain-containing protein [Anaerolineae bacterium]